MSAQVADASKYTLILYAVYVREEETYEDESPKKKNFFFFLRYFPEKKFVGVVPGSLSRNAYGLTKLVRVSI